jgi:ABC-type nickel/cobalt efflux system permease component RcnA
VPLVLLYFNITCTQNSTAKPIAAIKFTTEIALILIYRLLRIRETYGNASYHKIDHPDHTNHAQQHAHDQEKHIEPDGEIPEELISIKTKENLTETTPNRHANEIRIFWRATPLIYVYCSKYI